MVEISLTPFSPVSQNFACTFMNQHKLEPTVICGLKKQMENRETATKSFLLVTISNLFVNDDIKHLLLDEGFLTHLF